MEAGGRISPAGLDEGSTLDATGWFFFPDGSSVEPSAGRLIPPIPPTAGPKQTVRVVCKHGLKPAWLILTGGASVEVVVILGDISQDAEAVGDLESHHVFCIQQGWNPQLLLRNPEGLKTTNTHTRQTPTHTSDKYQHTHQAEGTEGNKGFYHMKSDSLDPLKAPEPAGIRPRR